ncbi:MAG: hypothetical protein ACRYF0_20505 [Janthinobacterium lividum]
MKKLGTLLLVMIASALLAGIYGILHDQLTYSISHEYFTKFKYAQFGFEPAWFGGDRPTVVVIGFLATWWVGLFIGTGLGLVALVLPDAAAMRKAVARAIGLVYSTAVIAGVVGFLYGKYYLTTAGVNWWLPANLVHKNDFITVGSIHNFGYAGGLIGLLVGILYLLKFRYSAVAAR